MIRFVNDIVTFAAERRLDQTEMEKNLYPEVSEALETYPATNWYADLLAEVTRLYIDTYHREGGTGRPPGIEGFVKDVRETLDKTENPTEATADRLSVWLSTAILNAATQEAVGDDDEFVVMEWVTMHDEDVRDAHTDTEGQQRPPGEPFDVAGFPMRYPGDPTAPIELWINCRCTLAPVLGTEAAQGGTMTATVAEAEPEAVSRPDGPIPWHGVLAPEGVWSGDKRQFLPDSLEFRDLPLPLTWQKESDDGHKRSITVASIETIERRGNLMHASGTFLDTPEADEAIGLIAHFGRYGVSVDADDAEFEFDEDAGAMSFSRARISGASIVGIPAFAEAFVSLGDAPMWEKVDDEVCDPKSPKYDEEACAALQAAALRDVSTEERKKDAKAGRAMPDGSYPIDNCSDLKNAIQAIGRAKDPGPVKAHIKRRKASLGCPEVDLPDSWAVIEAMRSKVEAGRGPGWVTNPDDTKRLHDYWTKKGQPGYAKINWGVPGDFNRCRALVGEKIAANSPEDMGYLNQICAQWHHDALGWWPGRPTSVDSEAFVKTSEDLGLEPSLIPDEPAPALTLVAGAGFCAPSEWFRNPDLDKPTPLTVTEDGRVFGHLAQWGVCHVGFDGVCVDPPRSNTDYAYFLTGEVVTDAGVIPVGNITMDGSHAPLRRAARPAMAHYDNTCTVVADVTCGEDDIGIWVAGWIRPGATDEQRYALRASGGLSGDWRMVNGHPKELIAALAVNSGGFPVPRVGIEDGVQVSLVAAGCVMRDDEQPATLEASTEELALAVAVHLRKIDARREKMQLLAARMGGTGGV